MELTIANILKKAAYLFFALGIAFVPFSYEIIPFHSQLINAFFADVCAFLFEIFTGKEVQNTAITSDSSPLFSLVFLLGTVSIILAILSDFLKIKQLGSKKIDDCLQLIFTFFLALILLKYGCQKLFKWQFYLPEPNILFTPFGQLDKDILFWSTMGTSRSYSLFMGVLEIFPALLMLFRRTRILGLLAALPVLINIVAINFSFDISVKIFSLFLLGLNLLLLFPFIKSLFHFFYLNKKTALSQPSIFLQKQPILKVTLKTFLIGMLFLETLLPYLKTMNFNDDLAARPYLHGAYELQEILNNEQRISLDSFPIKRLFVHRKGYLIFQNKADEMQDFKLEINQAKEQFILTNYDLSQRKLNYEFYPKDSLLILAFPYENHFFNLKMKQLDWRNLPALKNQFHWTIESIK